MQVVGRMLAVFLVVTALHTGLQVGIVIDCRFAQ